MLWKVLTAALLATMLLGPSAGAKNPQAANSFPPADSTAPTVSGSATVGSALTGNAGTWSPKGIKYAYQWLRCASACQPVAGATGTTYILAAADTTSTMRYQVTASNQMGSTIAVSTPTATVTQPAQPPADTQAPTAPPGLTVSSASATAVSVGWSASTDNVGVTGYDLYDNGALVTTTTSLSATASGLNCGTSYTLAVDAYDGAGNHSAQSSVTATTSACPSPPSPPAASGSIYWGAYIEGRQTYNYLYGGTWSNGPWCDPGTQCPLPKFTSNAGKAPSVEHWGMCWTCTFDSGVAQLVVGRGDIPAVDWSNDSSASDADIAAGKYDSYITAQAQAMKSFAHPLFLLWDEEMNGSWYPYAPGQNGNTAASFVAAWRHIHDIFAQVGATNVTWVWCPNVDTDNSMTPMSQLYPGDGYVDWTGLNGYNWGGSSWMSFAQVFTSSYNALLQVAPSKPIMIGETASEENGGSKAAWITDALATQLPQNFPKIKAVLWFNWRIYEKNQYWNWEIESSTASQQAFANAIASPYYAAGGGFGNLPLLSKIQPPS